MPRLVAPSVKQSMSLEPNSHLNEEEEKNSD